MGIHWSGVQRADAAKSVGDVPYEEACRCSGCSHHRIIGGNHECSARYSHLEPPAECAMDELVEWAIERGLDPEDIQFIVAWSLKRNAHIMSAIEEGLTLLVTPSSTKAEQSIALSPAERLAATVSIAKATLRRIGLRRRVPDAD